MNRIAGLITPVIFLALAGCDPGHFGKSFIRNESAYNLELKYKTRLKDSLIIIKPNSSVNFYQFAGIGTGNEYTCCSCDFTTIILRPTDSSKTLIKNITRHDNWTILNPNKTRFSHKEINCSFSVTQSDIIEAADAGASIGLEKLVYHSSRCFGTCPRIDLQIDTNRNIIISREFFKNKSTADTSLSGQFKGVLEQDSFNQLLKILRSGNYNNLNFPDIQCCDGPVTTLIIYSNGKRKYLKSMAPPAEASELISFLYKLGTDLKLPKTNEKLNIEE